jgi:asparagine synthase (glutamine-hydrolysing)
MERFWMQPGSGNRGERGTSTTASADGSVRVTVLGCSKAHNCAAVCLEHHLRDAAIPPHHQMPDIGYVTEDLRTGLTHVFASPIGKRQIFWSAAGGILKLASEPAGLSAAESSRELAPEVVYQYVYFHCLPGPLSAFAGVSKLDNGHSLVWNGREAAVTRYWRPVFASSPGFTLREAEARLKSILQSAVGRSLQSGDRCGAFLSGGLDSSTVAGFAAHQQPAIPTITMGFDAEGFDETEYARIASKHFGTRPLEYYVTPDDVARSLPDIAAAFPEPFGNSSAAAAYHCARIAKDHGIDTLLAGDGGDELFGGNDRYAVQLVFERYARVPGALRALLEPAVDAAARITRRFPIGKAQSYIQQAKVALPDRMETYNFLNRISPTTVFSKDVLDAVSVDAPLQLMRDEYAAPENADAIARILFLEWKFTLHHNDLVKVNTMCDLAGVRVAYPMLDPELVDFSLQIPSDWKVRGSNLRWFYKKALGDFLPHQIINKTKHGFGLPFGAWMRTHEGLRRISEDALQSLAKRRHFRQEFLKQAQRLHRDGHASYYGELVWILVVLELWLQRHMPRSGL